MSEKRDIGNVLKTAMDGYATTPDDLWPAIEANLKRQKRIRMLLWWLLLLGIVLSAMIVYTTINTEVSSSDKINTSVSNGKDHQNNPSRNEPIKKTVTTDSLSTELPTQHIKSKNSLSKSTPKPIKTYTRTNQEQKNTDHQNPKTNKGNSKIGSVKRTRSSYSTLLSMLEAEQLGNLELIIDSLEFPVALLLTEKAKTESTWRFSTFASLDHYNAFRRNTSKQSTFNYGAFLYFYATEYTALRIGVKRSDFQYNFSDRNDPSQQQVSYLEVPLEVRSFFSTKEKLKTSFIAGGSFLIVQDAMLTDFSNNSIFENKDIFTSSTFSMNAGFGLHYDIDSKWRLNLESVFKYHVEPFSRSQRFSPYNLSFIFGIEYGF